MVTFFILSTLRFVRKMFVNLFERGSANVTSKPAHNGDTAYSRAEESDRWDTFDAYVSAFNACVGLGWGCLRKSSDTSRLYLVNDPSIRTEGYIDDVDHTLLGMFVHSFGSTSSVISSRVYLDLLDSIGWNPFMIELHPSSAERSVSYRRKGIRERVEVSYRRSDGHRTFQLSELESDDLPAEMSATLCFTRPGQISYLMSLGTIRYLEEEMTYALNTEMDGEIIVGHGRIADTILCRVLWAGLAYVHDGGIIWVQNSNELSDAPRFGWVNLGDGSNDTADVHQFLREHEKSLRSSGVVERHRRK